MHKSPKFADYKAHKPFFREMIAMSRRNRLLVPEAADALQRMKFEIAREFGVELGPDTAARANGSVGGEMVKRLIALAQNQMTMS
jgi:small acid-soluble spore protein A (major alpha-type SASP)